MKKKKKRVINSKVLMAFSLITVISISFWVFLNMDNSLGIVSCEFCITDETVENLTSPSGNWRIEKTLVDSKAHGVMMVKIKPLYLDDNYKEMEPLTVPQYGSSFVMWDQRPQYQDVFWVFSTENVVQTVYFTYTVNGTWVSNIYQTGPHATACIPGVADIPEAVDLFEACEYL